MAEILLFHHALGRTKGIYAFAEALEKEGHTVHVPDLFEGRLFTAIEDGMAYVNEIGFEAIMERGSRAADELSREIVYGGFSLGVLAAQKLAQTREGCRGALFFHSCVPASMLGSSWPADLPVQVHGMDADPYFVDEGDLEAARELVAAAKRGELFLYPGDQHYFADSSLSSYDADASALLLQRVLGFLRQLGS
jgi:dienelactone hydrolase